MTAFYWNHCSSTFLASGLVTFVLSSRVFTCRIQVVWSYFLSSGVGMRLTGMLLYSLVHEYEIVDSVVVSKSVALHKSSSWIDALPSLLFLWLWLRSYPSWCFLRGRGKRILFKTLVLNWGISFTYFQFSVSLQPALLRLFAAVILFLTGSLFFASSFLMQARSVLKEFYSAS